MWKTYLVQNFIFHCCKTPNFLYFVLPDNIDHQTFGIDQMLYYNIIGHFNLHSLSNASSIEQHCSLIVVSTILILIPFLHLPRPFMSYHIVLCCEAEVAPHQDHGVWFVQVFLGEGDQLFSWCVGKGQQRASIQSYQKQSHINNREERLF